MTDVWVMLGFGVVGFVMRQLWLFAGAARHGSRASARWWRRRQSLLIFDHNPVMFLSRPIVVALFIVTAFSIAAPYLFRICRGLLRRRNPFSAHDRA